MNPLLQHCFSHRLMNLSGLFGFDWRPFGHCLQNTTNNKRLAGSVQAADRAAARGRAKLGAARLSSAQRWSCRNWTDRLVVASANNKPLVNCGSWKLAMGKKVRRSHAVCSKQPCFPVYLVFLHLFRLQIKPECPQSEPNLTIVLKIFCRSTSILSVFCLGSRVALPPLAAFFSSSFPPSPSTRQHGAAIVRRTKTGAAFPISDTRALTFGR